ncbi:MAG: acetyltransferase [Burkholderiales bacterium]|nr:acetyltransferase [Burkholderiales bacterium]
MTHFDVFNGDADGICALLQLRLAAPIESVLVTGAKRDIALLARVAARSGDTMTVLDISLATNREPLLRLLDLGVAVQYFDHHYAGTLPVHPGLDAHIDTSPSVCTGMLVDRFLSGRHRVWAVVAAFGDNLVIPARGLAATLSLSADRQTALHALGDCLTYNATCEQVDDAPVHPEALFRLLLRHADPFRFIDEDPVFAAIDAARRRDVALARSTPPAFTLPGATVVILPDAPWARRVRGIYGNEVANDAPQQAHAVLTRTVDGGFEVSVRAPRADARGADELCRCFAGGGGRAAAAGINHLPAHELLRFVEALGDAYPAV